MSTMNGEWELPPEVPPGVRGPSRPEGRARIMGLAYGVEPPMLENEYQEAMDNLHAVHYGSYRPMDPHRCVFNEAPKHSGVYFQCNTVIADPRKLRYCIEHAKKVGYPLTPDQLKEYTESETKIRLQGLSSRAVATLERVMDDPDAPAGVRAKAAESVLDRTGFHAKAGMDVQVEAVVIDMAEVIRQRLEAKRNQLQGVVTVEQLPVVTPEPPPENAS